jgi:hypothetical protein
MAAFEVTTEGWKTERSEIWQKSNEASGVTLAMELAEINFKKFGGPYIERFSLIRDDATFGVGEAEWADWDQRNRLVIARNGKLFEGQIGDNKLKLQELADFNENKPDPKQSPKWAKIW